MVLLEEEPHRLLHSVSENFVIDGDTAAIARITSHLTTLQHSREKQQGEQRHLLRLISRKLDVARDGYNEMVAEHAAAAHSATMTALDRDKFALAKSINDLESTTHTLEGRLAKLKEELEQLDSDDPMERAVLDGADDGTTLKLRLFRTLGIELQDDGAGGYSKLVVRNPAKGDVHVVKIEGKFTSYFYANYIWGLL